ncbi:hypothetical protein BKA82DRAFT_4140449 [Pisolithus tinctorius]|nr:hypothetical protein BKA82DRAFT_4140449 [Pisolithus tinctorius]
MSSLLSTGPPSAVTSAPSSTASSTTADLGSSSTLLFVFLISVLSLFSAFLTCGIVWHRLVARRRMIETMLQTGSPPTVEMFEKPEFWDVNMMPSRELPRWADEKPLAAKVEQSILLPDTQSPQPVPSTWRRRLIGFIPREVLRLFHRPSAPPSRRASVSTPRAAWPQDNSDVRFSVLIQMPYSPLAAADDGPEHRGLHDVVIGTTAVCYYDSDPS